MRLAIISDIHSNTGALETVLQDIETQSVDKILSLGDNVGYGTDPAGVIALLKEKKIDAILGNHELALLDSDYRKRFRGVARRAIDHNARLLDAEALGYIAALPFFRVVAGARFVHGLPPDSVTRSLALTPDFRLARIMSLLPQQISFVGHTHLMEVVRLKGETVTRTIMKNKRQVLDRAGRYMINAGSVGQPRDGTAHATYIVWDSVECLVAPRVVKG